MPTITLAQAGQISEPIEVGPGTRVTATGGYVQWTTGTLADVRNGAATWQTWPKGAATGYADTLRRIVMRAVATGALTVTWDESKQDEGPEGAYWQEHVLSAALDASGNMAGVVGPDNKIYRMGIMARDVFTTTGTTTVQGIWTVPQGVNNIFVTAAGGGSGGGGSAATGGFGAGGGGASHWIYQLAIPVNPGETLYYQVGGGGSGGAVGVDGGVGGTTYLRTVSHSGVRLLVYGATGSISTGKASAAGAAGAGGEGGGALYTGGAAGTTGAGGNALNFWPSASQFVPGAGVPGGGGGGGGGVNGGVGQAGGSYGNANSMFAASVGANGGAGGAAAGANAGGGAGGHGFPFRLVEGYVDVASEAAWQSNGAAGGTAGANMVAIGAGGPGAGGGGFAGGNGGPGLLVIEY